MTVVLDASALLALRIEGAQRDVVRDMLENDTTWVACAIALSAPSRGRGLSGGVHVHL